MKIYNYNTLTDNNVEKLCKRDYLMSDDVINRVKGIRDEVIFSGDIAVRNFAKRFDKADLQNFRVTNKEFEEASKYVSPELQNAIKTAKQNIWKFHEQQIKNRTEDKIETSEGVFCWREFKAIEKVGLYIPGGTAPLFSTVLMLTIPALIAGCKKIVLCAPANSEGLISPEILWVAKFLGIQDLYKIGGAQAIFAMAYGTKQVPKVDKIFGPGNQYVTAAKMLASSAVAIDMPAGPSEVLVIADENSNPAFVASDLLSQAEHGEDSQVVLVCNNKDKIQQVIQEIEKQLNNLPRKNIAKKALEQSFAILTRNLDEAIKFANQYSPEHLILSFDSFRKYLSKIQNAGSVFCGKYSAESFGDYASGTNHTLPTSGFAKSYSGISVLSFGKWITFQEVTKRGLENLGATVKIMAEREGLFGHKNAVTTRGEK